MLDIETIARELYEAYHRARGGVPPVWTWVEMPDHLKREWHMVAQRAFELLSPSSQTP